MPLTQKEIEEFSLQSSVLHLDPGAAYIISYNMRSVSRDGMKRIKEFLDGQNIKCIIVGCNGAETPWMKVFEVK